MMYRIFLSVFFAILISSCGEETSSTVSSNDVTQNESSYPYLEVGRTYIREETGYYKLNMPANGGHTISIGFNGGYGFVYKANLEEYVIDPDSEYPNRLPYYKSTYLPEGEYLIYVDTDDLNNFGLSKFMFSSIGITDQYALDSLEARTYTSSDTGGITRYYNLSMPTGGGDIHVNSSYSNDDFAFVYTADLHEYVIDPNSFYLNNLPSNDTVTYLPEGEYIIAVTVWGDDSYISFAF